MSIKTCLQCKRPIPARRSRPTENFPGGIPQGSLWLLITDKNENFCTMRCAAAFGIAIANEMTRARR